jgi:lysophospholipase L1-like esterase
MMRTMSATIGAAVRRRASWLAVASFGLATACMIAPPYVEPPPQAPRPAPATAPTLTPQQQRLLTDWADLDRYRDANAKLPPPAPGERRVVFYGNSITDSWAQYFPAMFPGKPYIGRGISGQTTPQMLVRFRQDVVALHPAAVVILAGTNDIAGNTGPSTLEMIEDNLASMAEIAQANGIRVILSSVLPVYDYPWKHGVEPAPRVAALNSWIRGYAETHHAVYLDYYSAMADERGGMRAGISSDGVHPTEAGYRIMAPLAEAAIAKALK